MRTRIVFWVMLGLVLTVLSSARGAEPPKPAQAQPVVAANSVFFLRDVMPLVNRLGCNSVQCHGSPLGEGGMALSMFGGDAEEDYGTIVKDQRGARVDRMEPAKSLLLSKVSGSIPHGGAQRIPPDSAEYKMLLAWIEQGAPYNDEKLPKLASVEVLPPELDAQKGQTQQLAVTAVYADGTKMDVTRLAEYGVPFITVPWGGGEVKGSFGWDMHEQVNKSLRLLCPILDQAVSALFEDLAQRGLLEDTIVMLYSESSKAPKWNVKPETLGGKHPRRERRARAL